MAKADETPPADWREAGAYPPGGDTVNQTWQPPKITAVSQ
jgi:hypothetical protein